MLEAKSMYHGGELVSALECDFESYRELGLLCPFCNEPVFLCGETVRQSSKTQKLSYIQPHFKHFPGKEPTDFDCEKRAISVEGKRYLDAIRAERRGQRLKLFNSMAWSYVWTGGDGSDPETEFRKFFLDMGIIKPRIVDDMLKNARILLSRDSQYFKNVLDRYVGYIVAPEEERASMSINPNGLSIQESKGIQDVLDSLIDQRIHRAICLEFLDFLSTKKARYCISKMFSLSMIWQAECTIFERGLLPKYEHKPFYRVTLNHVEFRFYWETFIDHVIKMIALTPWQQQLEEKSALLRSDTRARGFAKRN